MAVEFEVDGRDSLRRLAAALAAEENGAALKRGLARNLRAAVDPGVVETRSELMSMSTGGLSHEGESLRVVVAAQVAAQALMTGDSAGVRVRAGSRGPRGFRGAARRLNQAGGWRHPVFGKAGVWVAQLGKPGWFTRTLRGRRHEYREAVVAVMRDEAERIAREVG